MVHIIFLDETRRKIGLLTNVLTAIFPKSCTIVVSMMPLDIQTTTSYEKKPPGKHIGETYYIFRIVSFREKVGFLFLVRIHKWSIVSGTVYEGSNLIDVSQTYLSLLQTK